MSPPTFQPFGNVSFPCFLLGEDGTLHLNLAAKNAGKPLCNEEYMRVFLNACCLQMAADGTSVILRPILTSGLKMCNFTIMKTDDGILAVSEGEKESSISLISSEMREPLTNIFATLPLINAHIEDQHACYTQDIQANCYRLLRLASNFEDCGFVGTKNNELKTIDLTSLVEALCSSVAAVCKKQNAIIKWFLPKKPATVQADSRLISAALLNIICNSFAYTRDGNEITVKLSANKKNALLTVEDKGLGILPENITKIFEPFFSINPYGDGHVRPGLGIGLYVVRQAIAALGGTVAAESRFGEGTSILITLPLSNKTCNFFCSDCSEYMLNRYSQVFIQLSEYCFLPGL